MSPFEQKADRFLGILLRRLIATFFSIVIFGIAIAAFFKFQIFLDSSKIELNHFFPQSLIPLGILIAMSGLMYNRARAVGQNSRGQRFRSLYAAERLLASTCFYLTAMVVAVFATVCADGLIYILKIRVEDERNVREAMFLLCFPFLGWSIFEVSHTLRLIAPSGAYRRTIRVARKVKKLL